jgi:hypothetical protein
MALNEARSATLQQGVRGFESPWLHYLTLSEALSPPEETLKGSSTAAKCSNSARAGDGSQWSSSRSLTPLALESRVAGHLAHAFHP